MSATDVGGEFQPKDTSDLAAVFSADVLDLVTPEALEDLLAAGRMAREVLSSGSDIDQPGLYLSNEDFTIGRRLQVDPDGRTFVDDIVDLENTDLSSKHQWCVEKADLFPSVTDAEVDGDLQRLAEHRTRLEAFAQTVFAQIEAAQANNFALEPAERRHLIEQVSALYFAEGQSTRAVDLLVKYLSSEILIATYGKGGPIDQALPIIRDETPIDPITGLPAFRPFNKSPYRKPEKISDDLRRLAEGRPDRITITELVERFPTLGPTLWGAEAAELADRMVVVIQQASSQLLANLEAGYSVVNINDLPYPFRPEHQPVGEEDYTFDLFLLLNGITGPLARLQAELNTFSQRVCNITGEMEAQPGSLYQLVQERLNVHLAERGLSVLVKTRHEGLQQAVKDYFDSISADHKDLADTFAGKKPRVKGKKSTPQQESAVRTYDELYRLGFLPVEATLITAIVGAGADNFAARYQKLVDTHTRLMTACQELGMGLGKGADNGVATLVHFPIQEVLRTIEQKVTKIGRGRLTTQQNAQFNEALAVKTTLLAQTTGTEKS